MFKDEVAKIAKKKSVFVSFDMDGVIAEYDVSKNESHKMRGGDFYSSKRPIKTIIGVMQNLSKIPNVEVGILSCCHFVEQAEQKKIWLKANCPFLKNENIHIICYEETDFDTRDKYSLKTQLLEKLFSNADVEVFHVDDDVRVIKDMAKSERVVVKHISSLVE